MVGSTPIKTFVELTDSDYFCNKSWTISYNVNTQSWASFHTYLPNFYIGENNFFYSGLNESCDLDIFAGEIIYCGLGGEAVLVTTTTTTTQHRYTYLVYDMDDDCNTSNPVQYWSYTSYGSSFYFVNGGGSKKLVAVNVHTNYTNEITSLVLTSCTPPTTTTTTTTPLDCTLEGTAVWVDPMV